MRISILRLCTRDNGISNANFYPLAVPAASTSSESERLFLTAGLTLSDRRASLSGDSVDGLLFIHGMGWAEIKLTFPIGRTGTKFTLEP